jgi:hypothetical protein
MGKIQDADIKTAAELISAGAAESDLPNANKVYISAFSKRLDEAIADGDLTGAPAWGDITGTLSDQTDLQNALNLKANLASPAFTGNPTAPTQAAADNSTKLATTAYVETAVAIVSGSSPISPAVQKYTSGSGTHNRAYAFTITAGSATEGATYTNNSVTFTVLYTIASGTILHASGSGSPTSSGTLTKTGGTGDATLTFSLSHAPLYSKVTVVGGGGGGAGNTGGGSGGTGGNSTFGSTLLVGNGGTGGSPGSPGGAGGTASLGAGVYGLAISGGSGSGAQQSSTANILNVGGMGGNNPMGGAGGGGFNGNNAGAGADNTGGGGGGGAGVSSASAQASGSGGGAGGYAYGQINSPSATYAYAVGASGAAGTAGNNPGGAGGSGLVVVEEYFR